jgi:hypothetical protein
MIVLRDAWGVPVESQQYGQEFEIVELEVVVWYVPPEKIICVLDKHTGEVIPNPALPESAVSGDVARVLKLYAYGVRKGWLPLM